MTCYAFAFKDISEFEKKNVTKIKNEIFKIQQSTWIVCPPVCLCNLVRAISLEVHMSYQHTNERIFSPVSINLIFYHE